MLENEPVNLTVENCHMSVASGSAIELKPVAMHTSQANLDIDEVGMFELSQHRSGSITKSQEFRHSGRQPLPEQKSEPVFNAPSEHTFKPERSALPAPQVIPTSNQSTIDACIVSS